MLWYWFHGGQRDQDGIHTMNFDDIIQAACDPFRKAAEDAAGAAMKTLLNEVRACPPEDARNRVNEWQRRLDAIWPILERNDTYWYLLMGELPLKDCNIRNPTLKDLLCNYAAATEAPALDFSLWDVDEDLANCEPVRNDDSHKLRPLDVFICCCALQRLDQQVAADPLPVTAYRILAGCINLAKADRIANLTNDSTELLAILSRQISHYRRELLQIALDDWQTIKETEAGWSICDLIELVSCRERVDEREIEEILQNGEQWRRRTWGRREMALLSFLTKTPTVDLLHVIIPKLFVVSDFDAAVSEFWVETPRLSELFRREVDSLTVQRLDDVLKIWPHYLASDDAFAFCWKVLHPPADHSGETTYDRLVTLSGLLLGKAQQAPTILLTEPERVASERWRHWYYDLFKALGTLSSGNGDHRSTEENWIRQSEAIELLTTEPAQLANVVGGILKRGESFWDVFDPIILGLSHEPTLAYLEQFVVENQESTKAWFHAKRLIAHLRGTLPRGEVPSNSPGLLGAVETLIQVSRSRVPDSRVRTWLGDAHVESLWYGAIEKAMNEFNLYLDPQYGHDEHEHVAVFAEKLRDNLNQTNAVIAGWLSAKQATPLAIDLSFRRFPKTAAGDFPQEGGKTGLQADLAFLIDCDVPGLMKSKRVTLVQAKKLGQLKSPLRWAPGFPFPEAAYDQLTWLLERSSKAHYLFFLHPTLGGTPLIFPALSVRDSCKANSPRGVPLSVVTNGGKLVPEFLLHDIIGLWTGDDDAELVSLCESGRKIFQGPTVMITVKITAKKDQRG